MCVLEATHDGHLSPGNLALVTVLAARLLGLDGLVMMPCLFAHS